MRLRAETSEVASRCACGWPQFSILPWVAAGAWVGPTAPLPGSRTWSPRPSRRRQDRQRAAGVEAAEPVRSSGDSRYIFTVNPAGPTSSICYPIRTAAPLVLRRQQDRCRRTCPNGRITTALVDPDGSGLVTKAIPDPSIRGDSALQRSGTHTWTQRRSPPFRATPTQGGSMVTGPFDSKQGARRGDDQQLLTHDGSPSSVASCEPGYQREHELAAPRRCWRSMLR
jgi:hypothetical protein